MKKEGKKKLKNKNSGKKPARQENAKDSEKQPGGNFGKSASDILAGINTLFENGFTFAKNVKELIFLVPGFVVWLSGHKLFGWVGIVIAVSVLVFHGVKKFGHKSVFTAVCAGIAVFSLMMTASLAAFGYIQFNPHPGEQDDEQSGSGADKVTDDPAELETVDSTESPVLTYKEMTFEDKIDSNVWRPLLAVALDAKEKNTWTKESFNTFSQDVFACMNELASAGDWKAEKQHTETLRKNVDEIARLGRESSGWEKFTQISELRAENYACYPSLDNAHQSGIAALDCLDWMGKMNGKEGKGLNTSVYNEKHVLQYGVRAVDGFFGWWSMARVSAGNQEADEIYFYFGQTFHHFGGYDDMTGDRVSDSHLLLAAVCYCRVAVDDENLYRLGQASEKQYRSCLYAAIVFDKLDNRLRPDDPFFLEEAEKYYRYASYNSNLSTEEAKKIEGYRKIVEDKKAKRGMQASETYKIPLNPHF